MRESNQGSSQFNFDVGNRKVYSYFTFVKNLCCIGDWIVNSHDALLQ